MSKNERRWRNRRKRKESLGFLHFILHSLILTRLFFVCFSHWTPQTLTFHSTIIIGFIRCSSARSLNHPDEWWVVCCFVSRLINVRDNQHSPIEPYTHVNCETMQSSRQTWPRRQSRVKYCWKNNVLHAKKAKYENVIWIFPSSSSFTLPCYCYGLPPPASNKQTW